MYIHMVPSSCTSEILATCFSLSTEKMLSCKNQDKVLWKK